jgi:2-keto-4-pentenoate hydratase/2-oxohepta-3-ene-1,7-dioic acid hydratase in catechol pathway
MKIANLNGRLVVIHGALALDVAEASDGRFDADPQAVFERWDEFADWAQNPGGSATEFDPAALGAPVPRPRQVFGIGINYADHAAESGSEKPTFPPTFTKFPTCIAGPNDVVDLPSEFVDWEVELVAVIGRHAHRVSEADGWSHVAGLTIGQDLSERMVQLRPPVPQFSLGKSYPRFGPMGPWIVTVDEFANPDDLAIGCSVSGEEMQKSRTSQLIFGVPQLVSLLSSITPLLPGDVIFTGTPSGVGGARKPPHFLTASDEIVSVIEGIGEFRTRFA